MRIETLNWFMMCDVAMSSVPEKADNASPFLESCWGILFITCALHVPQRLWENRPKRIKA